MCFLVEKYAPSSKKNTVDTAGFSTPKPPPTPASATAVTGTTERVKTPTLNDDAVYATDQAQMPNLEAETTATAEIVQQPESSSLKWEPIALTEPPTERSQQAGPATGAENDAAAHLSPLHSASTATPSASTGPGMTQQIDSTPDPSSLGLGTVAKSGDTGLKLDGGSPTSDHSRMPPGTASTGSAGVEEEETGSFPDPQTSLADALENLKPGFAHYRDDAHRYSSSY